MALDALLAALEQEAGAKANALLEEARAEANRVRAATESGIARRRHDALRVAGETAQAEEDARVAELRRSLRGEVMRARADMLERVFAQAAASFRSAVCAPAFRAALAQHLEEALAFTEAGEAATLRCRRELADLIRPLVAQHAGVRLVEDAGAGWGIHLQVAGSGLDIDNTLEARMERARRALAIQIVRSVEARDDARLG